MIAEAGRSPGASSSRAVLCYIIALVGGAAAWILPARMAGTVEAWDGSLWWLWLLGTAGLSFTVSFIDPPRKWQWPFWIVGAQLFALLMQRPQLGNLVPLGAVLFLAVAALNLVPAFAGAAAGAGSSNRTDHHPTIS